MKIVAIALLSVSFAVLIDAKLPSLTSPCGEYISGSFTKLWSPILEKLVNILPDCAQGYVQAMIIHLPDCDEAFTCNDACALSVWFKIYPTLFSMVLPFVDDDSLKDAMTCGVSNSKALQLQASKGVVDMKSIQDFFGKLSTGMDDSLNNYCPPPPCPPPRKPLINLSIL